MKKTLAILFALAGAVGVTFAEDAASAPVVSGGVQTGLWVYAADNDSTPNAVARNFSNTLDNGQPNYANMKVTYAGNSGGLCFGIATNDFTKFTDKSGNSMVYDSLQVDYAYGYLNFGSLAKLTLGMMADNTFATDWNYYMSKDVRQSEVGCLIDVTPGEGFHVGAYVPLADSNALTAYIDPTAKPVNALDYLGEADFLFKYDSGPIIVKAGYAMSQFNGAKPAANQSDIYLGLTYNGIQDLYLDAEAGLANIGSSDADSKTASSCALTEWAKYTIGDLGLGLVLNETIYAANGSLGYRVGPDVNYTLGGVKFGLCGRYLVTANAADTSTVASFRVKPYANVTVGQFTLKPYFQFDNSKTANLGSGSGANVWNIGFDVAFTF